jgi:hypothetical protein
MQQNLSEVGVAELTDVLEAEDVSDELGVPELDGVSLDVAVCSASTERQGEVEMLSTARLRAPYWRKRKPGRPATHERSPRLQDGGLELLHASPAAKAKPQRTSLELGVLEEDGVCVPVAVSELEGVPVLLGVDVCGRGHGTRGGCIRGEKCTCNNSLA